MRPTHRCLDPGACRVRLASANGQNHGIDANAKPAWAAKEQQPWGIAGAARRANRTVIIRMTDDMRSHPECIRVRVGETVRFVLRNEDRMLHEMVIGIQAVMHEHAALMREFPDMEHDEPLMAHVAHGKTGEIVWLFNRTDQFDFACLIPGHDEAGMAGRIRVMP